MNFDFGLLVDINIQNHLVVFVDVISLYEVDFRIFISFFFKISVCQDFLFVEHLRSDLGVFNQTQFGFQIFFFGFFDSVVIDLGYSGTLA